MHSFRGMRKSYVFKEVFDSLRTVRSSDVFEREAVNGRRCFFDNYRVTHLRNIVKNLAIRNHFKWS